MSDDTLVRQSARELARLIRNRAVSPIEVLDAHLAVIAALNPKLNAVVTLAEESAREHARRAEQAVMRGEPLGALHGLPTRGSMNRSQRDGGLPPDSVVQDEDAILADSERLVARYHQAGEGAMIQIALAPCSPFSVTTSLMRATAGPSRCAVAHASCRNRGRESLLPGSPPMPAARLSGGVRVAE